MKKVYYLLSYVVIFLFLNVSQAKDYKKIQWIDLLPADDLQALMEEPDPSTILEGSSADSLTSHLSIKIDDPVTAYERALISFEVKKDFDNQNIKIPGYIVPVNTSEDGKIISFFLVPFFGACLHLPPPPPNQIIFVTSVKGIKIEDINEAYWIEGTITTKSRYDDVANSAYSMVMNDFYMFKEGDSY